MCDSALTRYNAGMDPDVFTECDEESPEAKARWFQSLPMQDRMELLCAYTDLILSVNPRIADAKNAEQTSGSVRILTSPRR